MSDTASANAGGQSVRTPADPADRTGVRVPPPVIYVAGIAMGWLLGGWLPLPIPGGTLLAVAAFLWIAVGAGLAAWGLIAFHRAGTTFNPFGGTTAIVVAGPYRYTRNPMYLGLACVQIGVALALREGWILVLLMPVLIVIDRQVIRLEERYLERKHGSAWQSYTRRVRRWL